MVAQQVAVQDRRPAGFSLPENVTFPAPVATPRLSRPHSLVRRRQIVSGFDGMHLVALLGALISGATAAWLVLLAVGGG